MKWNTLVTNIGMTADEYILRNVGSMTDAEIATSLRSAGYSVTDNAVRHARRRLGATKVLSQTLIPVSSLPKYSEPLRMEGDCVILPDIQAPFHHAEFLNNVLDLCSVWGIKKAVLAGDAIENASLTHFDPAWMEDESKSLNDDLANDLTALRDTLPKDQQGRLTAILNEYSQQKGRSLVGVGDEWHQARRVLRRVVLMFEDIIWELGNHEGRILKQMRSPIFPTDLKRIFFTTDNEQAKVRISPHYYCIVVSAGIEWLIEHPSSSARGDAQYYASKYQMNVIMAHSHHWMQTRDRSGKFWAIESGCIVDEERLPYVSQRHNKGFKHMLGATIIRNGKPWLLGEDSDWKALRRMR